VAIHEEGELLYRISECSVGVSMPLVNQHAEPMSKQAEVVPTSKFVQLQPMSCLISAFWEPHDNNAIASLA
jgi:hypothetical protein